MLQRTEKQGISPSPHISDINPLMPFTCCNARKGRQTVNKNLTSPASFARLAAMTSDTTLLPHIPLIAFDLDGTLANTEALSLPSAVETMRGFGVPVTLEYWYEHLHGRSGQSLIDAIREQFGIEVDLKEFLRRRAEMVPQMFANGVAPAPGMLQAVRNLVAGGQQLCICSNSTPERIAFTLEKITGQHSAGINLPQVFEGHMYSASGSDGSGKAKPAPDVYMHAAQHYKASAPRCVAVEDSPVGVASAVGAGFICVGYIGLGHGAPAHVAESLKQAGAHHILPHWDDFIPLLKSI